MITNQFRIYLCHFHCSHWQNHLLNFTFRERGPSVLVKTTFSSLFWNKLLIPHANCNGHVPFNVFHHIRPQNDTLGFFGRKYLSEQHWQMRHIKLHGCKSGRLLGIRSFTGDTSNDIHFPGFIQQDEPPFYLLRRLIYAFWWGTHNSASGQLGRVNSACFEGYTNTLSQHTYLFNYSLINIYFMT